jgi:hypothetical protein
LGESDVVFLGDIFKPFPRRRNLGCIGEKMGRLLTNDAHVISPSKPKVLRALGGVDLLNFSGVKMELGPRFGVSVVQVNNVNNRLFSLGFGLLFCPSNGNRVGAEGGKGNQCERDGQDEFSGFFVPYTPLRHGGSHLARTFMNNRKKTILASGREKGSEKEKGAPESSIHSP